MYTITIDSNNINLQTCSFLLPFDQALATSCQRALQPLHQRTTKYRLYGTWRASSLQHARTLSLLPVEWGAAATGDSHHSRDGGLRRSGGMSRWGGAAGPPRHRRGHDCHCRSLDSEHGVGQPVETRQRLGSCRPASMKRADVEYLFILF